jgi:hypothetical protein
MNQDKSSYNPYSLRVLIEAMNLQISKGEDYQFGSIKQAMYYPRGVDTMLDTIQSKIYRCKSLIEKYQGGLKENNESLRDSLLDIINTASFAVSYYDGKMEGQNSNKDFLNKEKDQ